jgi:hypothetical protein
MAGHSPWHPKVDGSSPANAVDVGRYNVEKTESKLTLWLRAVAEYLPNYPNF